MPTPAGRDLVAMETRSEDTCPPQRRFRIWVVGRLERQFVDGLGDVVLADGAEGSTLDGVLVDQSQFRGLLDRLWQLGIEVSKFETYRSDPQHPSPER